MGNSSSGSEGYFDKVAEAWEAMREGFFPDELAVSALERASLRPGALAVDVGAGSGFLTRRLLARGLRVIAVDRSEAMIEQLQKLPQGEGVLEAIKAEATNLPLPSRIADYVFANMCLHHVEEPEAGIREMVRVLSPGGRLVITDLDRHEHDFLLEEHQDRWPGFLREEIRDWFLAAGLEDVAVGCTGWDCCTDARSGLESAQISIFAASGTRPAG